MQACNYAYSIVRMCMLYINYHIAGNVGGVKLGELVFIVLPSKILKVRKKIAHNFGIVCAENR